MSAATADDDPLAALEAEFAATAPTEDVTDFSACDTLELAEHNARIRTRLFELGEMLSPKTDEGRHLHSERAALMIVMHNRFHGQ